MDKLSTVSVDDLHAALERVSTRKAAKRLMIALAYKDSVPVETLNERYAIPGSTVYYWLDRFERTPIDEDIQDEDRPRQSPILPPNGYDKFHANIVQSPHMFSFEVGPWSTELFKTI